MNNFPSKEAVERLRREYPAGTRVELITMDDPYSKLKPGDRGFVIAVDDQLLHKSVGVEVLLSC